MPPLISGFTIVRNGVKFAYPFLESIQSALPICDEFIVNVGESEDSTLQAIQSLCAKLLPEQAAKIQIFQTRWPLDDPEKRKGGRILAEQTNLALARCKGTWCLYLQADEVLHEQDWALIRSEAEKQRDNAAVEAFVFGYVHFYADYSTVQTSRSSYRREIRMIRNGLGIQSTGDAQSFRSAPEAGARKPRALLLDAKIYHYGWVRPQEVMKTKTGFMDTLYHQGAKADAPATGNNYLYKRFVGLKPFCGSHPAIMKSRVENAEDFDFSRAPRVFEIKDLWKTVSGWIEGATGWRPFEYKSYQIVRK